MSSESRSLTERLRERARGLLSSGAGWSDDSITSTLLREAADQIVADAATIEDLDDVRDGLHTKIRLLEAQIVADAERIRSLRDWLSLIASRACGCQLQPWDPNSDEPTPEFVAVNDIRQWALEAIEAREISS